MKKFVDRKDIESLKLRFIPTGNGEVPDHEEIKYCPIEEVFSGEKIVCGVDTADLDDEHGLAAIIVCKIHPTGIIEVLENKTAKDRNEFNTYVQEIKSHYNCEVSEVGNATRKESKHSKHSRLVDVTKLFEDKINFFIKKNEKPL